MRRIRFSLMLTGGLFLGTALPLPAQDSTERVEKRRDELFQPGVGASAAGLRTRPLRWKGPGFLERPELPANVYQGLPPRLEPPARKPVLPRPLRQGVPLAEYQTPPEVPRPVELPAEPTVRLWSPDPNVPLPLPTLGQPTPDRASLGDPALAESVAAALRPLTPARTRPVPFEPLNLPDPFEHVRAGRLADPPAEDDQPPAVPVQTPGKKS